MKPDHNSIKISLMLADVDGTLVTDDKVAPNDVRIFEKSGLSIAMGNASPEVQAEASFVTLSNEGEDFAYAMDKFVLPAATSLSTP